MKFLVILIAVAIVVAADDESSEEGPLKCYKCEGGVDSACHRPEPEFEGAGIEIEVCESGADYCEGRELYTEDGEKHFVRGCSHECYSACWAPRNETNSEGIAYVHICSKCCDDHLCNDMNDMAAGATAQRIGLFTIIANLAVILFARFF